MRRVLVLSGGGDHDDPWHPFAETSDAVRELLESAGTDVSITTEVAAAVRAASSSREPWDLVVLNLGSGARSLPSDHDVVAGLAGYVRGGGRLLVLHVSTTAFPGEPEWERMIGGRWVRGETFHPPSGPASVAVTPVEHPVTSGLGDFDVVDELYTRLRVAPTADVLVTHRYEDVDHPLVWARGDRVLVDALGHDRRSYRSGGHRTLLLRAARWLLGDDPLDESVHLDS